MKLLYCHIDNFGKIHDFSVNFADGMHVIHEPNGWGKSTLAAFIKVMFFGFDTKREAGSFEKERNLYRPWQGGAYGGELEFETGGRMYRISRTFGKTEKADEFHLYDCVTNLECDDFSWNIGEELFDLDAASFKRSIFFTQNDCASRTTDAINAKLGNLVENTNDINNYESAQERLRNLANQLSPNRVTGSLKKRRNQIAAAEQELLGFEAAEQGAAELRQKKQQATDDRENLMEKRDFYAGLLREASEESRRKELQKTYEALCSDQAEKESALQPFVELFPNGMPDEELLKDQIASARKLEEDRNSLTHLALDESEAADFGQQQEMFASGVPEDEEIDERLARLKEIPAIRDACMRIEMELSKKERESLQLTAPPEYEPSKFSAGTVLGSLFLLAGIACVLVGMMYISTTSVGMLLVIAGAAAFFLGNIILVVGIRMRAARMEESAHARREWEEQQRLIREETLRLQDEEAAKEAVIEQIYRETEAFLVQYVPEADEASEEEAIIAEEAEEILDLNLDDEKAVESVEETLEQEEKLLAEAAQKLEAPATAAASAGQAVELQAYVAAAKQGAQDSGTAAEPAAPNPDEAAAPVAQNPDESEAPKVENPGAPVKTSVLGIEESEYADQLRELKQLAHEYLRLREKDAKHEIYRAAVQKRQGDLLTYGRSLGHTLGADITAELTTLATEAVKYRLAEETAQAAQAKVLAFEEEHDKTELLRKSRMEYSIEEIHENMKSLDEEIEAARDGIEQYARQLEELEEQLDLRDEKEQELADMVELSEQEQKLYDTVTLTQDYLQKAREQFTARYMAPISNAFRKYFHLLAGSEEERSWQIDANINFRMKEQGEMREIKWLSAGYQDLIGICMRLAMVEAMYRSEKPFLILDDPFVNLDEEKTKRGMQLLSAVAKEYQILYFTCHSSREP